MPERIGEGAAPASSTKMPTTGGAADDQRALIKEHLLNAIVTTCSEQTAVRLTEKVIEAFNGRPQQLWAKIGATGHGRGA